MKRVRVEYKKDGIFIFLSNLDMIRYWERALRRSELPLYFTLGFNPKPKMDFSLALPLGIPSESEIFDFYLNEDLSLDEVKEKLILKVDRELVIKRIKEVSLNSKSISSQITHIEIEIYGDYFEEFNFEKDFIYIEEEIENGKRLIVSKNLSLRKLYNELKNFMKDKIFIRKIRNLKIEDGKIIDVFDL